MYSYHKKRKLNDDNNDNNNNNNYNLLNNTFYSFNILEINKQKIKINKLEKITTEIIGELKLLHNEKQKLNDIIDNLKHNQVQKSNELSSLKKENKQISKKLNDVLDDIRENSKSTLALELSNIKIENTLSNLKIEDDATAKDYSQSYIT